MQVGIILGVLSICGGISSGILTAKAFSEGDWLPVTRRMGILRELVLSGYGKIDCLALASEILE